MASDKILNRISAGRITRPQKAVIYGPEGIGKSTIASQFPAPVFLDTEGGTHHLDVFRLPAPQSWEEVPQAIGALAGAPHQYRTLVIDTADWLERLLIEHICQRANKTSIEDFGYGKGYVVLAEEVSLLAHCRIVKFEQPDTTGAYDRYELKLTKQVAPLIKEWSDLLLFTNFFTRIAENDSGKKRGVGGRERVFYTSRTAAWDAKNRHGFEEKLPFTFEAIASAFGGESKTLSPAATASEKSQAERLTEIFGTRLTAALSFLVARGQITNQGSLADVKSDYAARILAAPEKFIEALDAFKKGGAQ